MTDPVELWSVARARGVSEAARCTAALLNRPVVACVVLPNLLRSAPDSVTRQQKNYFDESFGPFYRTEQVIISTHDGSPVISYKNFNLTFDVLEAVMNVKTVRSEAAWCAPRSARAPFWSSERSAHETKRERNRMGPTADRWTRTATR